MEMAKIHPMLLGKSAEDLKHHLPLVIHEDAGPFTKRTSPILIPFPCSEILLPRPPWLQYNPGLASGSCCSPCGQANYFVLLKLAMPRFRPQNKIDFSKLDLLVGPISFIPKGTMGQVLMNVSCDSSVNIPSQMPYGLPLNGSTCKSIVPRCRDTTSMGDSVKASTS